MAFSTSGLLSLTIAGALALTACGADATLDAAKGTLPASAETTAAPTTQAPATTPTTVEEPTTTAAPETTTTTVEETTTTPAPAIAGPVDGVLYTDAGGQYSLLTSPDWGDPSPAFPDNIIGWFTGQDTDAFRQNLNILTSDIPNETLVQDILDAGEVEVAASFEGFVLIGSDVVTRPGQPDIGVLEYTAMQSGLDIRFLQVFGIWNDTLVVLTGSTSAATGDEAAERLRPYALTLAPPA